MAKQIKYSEPTAYFPKSIADKFKKTTKTTAKKTTKKSK